MQPSVCANSSCLLGHPLFRLCRGLVPIYAIAQDNDHPLLRLINEISNKVLAPVKNVIPAFGGLDFSPLFGLILIQYLQNFLGGLIQSLV